MAPENNDNKEPTNLLLVSGNKGSKEDSKEYVKRLANAILQVFYKHYSVLLRCVGAAAVNNAMKACIIAKGEAQKKDDRLIIDPSFTTVDFKGEEKTGIVMEVTAIE